MPRPSAPDRLAVNLFDITRMDRELRESLLGGKLDLRRESVLRLSEENLTETAVPFTCDLLEAATTCDVIREQDWKAGDERTRVYLSRAGGKWTRISSSSLLTVKTADGVALNPAVFPPAPEFDPTEPPRRALA